MRIWSVRVFSSVGIAIGAVTVFCLVASAETFDELYAKAKAEKNLVLWGGGPAANYERAARAFEQKYPGITVSVEGGASNVFNRRIEEQIKNQKIETDLIVLRTIQDLVAWKKRSLLMPFKPEGFEKISASAKDKDGSWIATNLNEQRNSVFGRFCKTSTLICRRSAMHFAELSRPEFQGTNPE